MDTQPGEHIGIKDSLRELIVDTWAGLTRGPGAVLALSMAFLLLWRYYGYPWFYSVHIEAALGSWRYEHIGGSLYWFASELLLLGVLPVLAGRFLWKLSLRDMGLGLGDWRLGLTATGIFYAIMVPLVLAASHFSDFQATYPLDGDALASPDTFLLYETGYASFFVSWEFFFRGFMLSALAPWFGPAAIGVQMVPFAVMHIGKPIAEMLGSVVAGVFLGVLAWRTRSIWYCALIHASVAITMDIIVYLR